MAISRFFITTFFFTFALFASPQDFKSCQLKYQVSSVPLDKTQGFAVDDKYVLFYSKKAPSFNVLKRDPFLGLNLIQADKNFKHIFKFYKNNPKQLASVSPNAVAEGKLVQEQIGLNQLAKFSSQAKINALISGTCCGLVGLSTGEGVITKEYIQHFLESKEIVYSDIGIRLADKKGVRVIEVNPFFEGSPFLLDDVIVYMDGNKVKSAAKVSRDILFSRPESTHHFLVLRDGKKRRLQVTFKKRLSGGLLADSFFDLFGLELNEKLIVKKDAPIYEIKKNDQLLFVMGKEVSSLSDIRQILSHEKMTQTKLVTLLFKREGFDFFIHFDKPINSN